MLMTKVTAINTACTYSMQHDYIGVSSPDDVVNWVVVNWVVVENSLMSPTELMAATDT